MRCLGLLSPRFLMCARVGVLLSGCACCARHSASLSSKAPEWRVAWASFLHDDHKATHFWMVHLNLGVLFILAVMAVFATKASKSDFFFFNSIAGSPTQIQPWCAVAALAVEGTVVTVTMLVTLGPLWLSLRRQTLKKRQRWQLPLMVATSVVASFGGWVNLAWFQVQNCICA